MTRERKATLKRLVEEAFASSLRPPGPLDTYAANVLDLRLKKPMRDMERALLARAFHLAEGNVTTTGKLLGLHRKSADRLLRKHKLR